jgi:hypothetical protein
MSWFGWLAYGFGRSAGKAILENGDEDAGPSGEPVQQQTEAEIREAERRYDEEAKRYAEEDAARRRG